MYRRVPSASAARHPIVAFDGLDLMPQLYPTLSTRRRQARVATRIEPWRPTVIQMR
jgi:hypothetical protein